MPTIIRDGASLTGVTGASPVRCELPVLIPVRTDALPPNALLDVPWVGVDAKQLFGKVRTDGSVRSRLAGVTPSGLRSALRVTENTCVIGILNGADSVLEGFWAMSRRSFYNDAMNAGFDFLTGPTFSVVQEGVEVPAAHNVAMLRRHHRVMMEIAEAGLATAPNMYWRDARGRQQWVQWLRSNQEVWLISRDFSRSKTAETFRSHLNGLTEIIRQTGRPLHVLLVGVGPKNGGYAMRRLADVGGTCSIVTSDPIAAAMYGGKRLRLTPAGELVRARSVATNRLALVNPNLRAASDYLMGIATDLPGYPLSLAR